MIQLCLLCELFDCEMLQIEPRLSRELPSKLLSYWPEDLNKELTSQPYCSPRWHLNLIEFLQALWICLSSQTVGPMISLCQTSFPVPSPMLRTLFLQLFHLHHFGATKSIKRTPRCLCSGREPVHHHVHPQHSESPRCPRARSYHLRGSEVWRGFWNHIYLFVSQSDSPD